MKRLRKLIPVLALMFIMLGIISPTTAVYASPSTILTEYISFLPEPVTISASGGTYNFYATVNGDGVQKFDIDVGNSGNWYSLYLNSIYITPAGGSYSCSWFTSTRLICTAGPSSYLHTISIYGDPTSPASAVTFVSRSQTPTLSDTMLYTISS
jgi:hypothetical protein